MPEPKTKRTEKSAADFFASIKDEQVRTDCKTIAAIMQAATKEKPVMWGSYLKRLSDIHLPTLKKLVAAAVKERRKTDLSSKANNLAKSSLG